jgi:hypothetical protein
MSKIEYLPDRVPVPEDYPTGVVVELVHINPFNESPWNTREEVIVARVLALAEAGISVQCVDIESVAPVKPVVLGGALEDVCVNLRAQWLRDLGVAVIVDLALTSRY